MSGSEVTVRRVGPEDAEAYRALRLSALADHPADFGASYGEEAEETVAMVAHRLDRATTLGALNGGRLVAVATLIEPNAHRAKLRHTAAIVGVFTRSDWRRQGLSRRLLGTLIAGAPSHVTHVAITVSAENPAALAAYESLGFVVWGRQPAALKIGGRLVDELHLVLMRE